MSGLQPLAPEYILKTDDRLKIQSETPYLHYNVKGDGTVEIEHAEQTLKYIKNTVYINTPQNYTYHTEMGFHGYAHAITKNEIEYVRKWIDETILTNNGWNTKSIL